MREILFRGIDKRSGEWVYGSFIPLLSKDTKQDVGGIKDDTIYRQVHLCKLETVGQYTGLTDKNGTKIFEGDILVDEGDKVVSVVEFRNGMFCLVDYEIIDAAGDFDEYDCQPMDNYYIDEMKIDGNIHDNPELLRGDKQ